MKDASHGIEWGSGLILVALVIFTAHRSNAVFADEVSKSDSGKFDSASLVTLENASVTESSGLAFSNLNSDLLWTHNDSGDSARLFAFDRSGKTTGGCQLVGVDAVDFEDMASFVQDSVARLVVADVGDNGSVRPFVSLYFFDEPPPDQRTSVKDWTRIDLRYAEGPRDCEAIMVDARRGIVTLITKSLLPVASVYELPLPKRVGHNGDATAAEARVLTRVATVPIPLATAADHDPASGDSIVTNYFQMFRYAGGQNDKAWWQSTPTAIDLPRLKQIEAVAADRNGDVWVTSEASPTPLAKIKRVPK